MTRTAHEFIRRFLLHVLPDGFHRIRHYGLLASSRRAHHHQGHDLAAAVSAARPSGTGVLNCWNASLFCEQRVCVGRRSTILSSIGSAAAWELAFGTAPSHICAGTTPLQPRRASCATCRIAARCVKRRAASSYFTALRLSRIDASALPYFSCAAGAAQKVSTRPFVSVT